MRQKQLGEKVPEPKGPDYKAIAQAIEKVSEHARALNQAGLTREAVLVLLKHKTGLPMHRIRMVLDAASDLKSWCIRQ